MCTRIKQGHPPRRYCFVIRDRLTTPRGQRARGLMNMININKHALGLVNATGADGEPASSRALAEPFVVKQSDCDRQSTGLMGSFFHMNIPNEYYIIPNEYYIIPNEYYIMQSGISD